MASASTPINIPSVNSSIDSVKLADGSPVGFSATGGAKNVNFLSQLEHMMGAVKKEASALENMKLKLKDMDELKNKLNDAKTRLATAESENQQLRRMVKDSDDQNVEIRNDMQRLNDIYYAERTKLTEAQQFSTRLEQEISGIKLEKEFFSKEASKVPELKSALKTAKSQLSAAKKNADDEKAQIESHLVDLTKKCASLEKANEDSGRHLFNLTENLNAAQNKITELEVAAATETEKLNREKQHRALINDRYLMSTEDLRLQIARLPASTLAFETRIDGLKSELQKLKIHATGKTNELFLITTESKKMQEKLEQGAQAYTTQITTLQETVREMNAKSNEIVKSNSSLKTKLQSKTAECENAVKECGEVKTLYKQLQLAAQQRESEATQAIKGLNLQVEDYSFKLQSVNAQLEAVQQQTKSEQGKHWEEVKQLKDSESLLLEECDRITQELQEKTLQLHTLQANSSSTESNLRSECNSASSMVSTLKDELEKRLKVIVLLREERDALQADKEELSGTIDALKSDLSKNDGVFKRTLESDRSKMKQELLNRTQRIRALESEKQELLSETEQLVSQVTDTRNEINSLQARYNDLLSTKDTLSEQYDVVRSHNNQLLSDVQSGDRQQEELRATIERNNVLHSENTERLEMLLRESKKSASLQVLEMSQHIKSMSADYDTLQLEHEKSQDNEKRAVLDLERARNELNNVNLQHNDTLQQATNDNNNLRREVQELRNKHKLSNEVRGKMEMELVNLRNDIGRHEMETHKLNIVLKEQESSVVSLQESVNVLTAQLSNTNESVGRYKIVVAELEDGMQRKNGTIDGLKEELVQLERDGLLEIRRLRVQLNSAENEISELRPMIPLLQKEASDAKNTLSSLKNNQSGAVNNLLEEVRRAEETLTRERKKAAAEVDGCHGRIVELQAQLEKTRELLEESTSKAKTDRSERDLRLMQLEGEAERAKSAAASKEGRIEELVQQHHADRVKIHELHEKASSAETEMASLKSSLSHEQAARQRLETRLRSLMSTPDYAAEGIGGGFLSARGHSSSGNRPGGGSSLLHSAKNNYGSAAGGGGSGVGKEGGIGGSGVTNSMFRASSNDQWEEETDDYSIANTAHTNHSSHTVHTANTMPYNRYDDHHTSNNTTSVRAQSPFNPSRYTVNDDYSNNTNNTSNTNLRQSRAEPNLGNNLSDRSYSDSHSRSPPPNGMMSPSRDQLTSSTRHAQSPVVDRVSAALAAKAIPETSKNALKYAQQQRSGMNGSASRHGAGSGVGGAGVGGVVGGGMSGSSSVSGLTLNIPSSMSSSHSSSAIMYGSNNTDTNTTNTTITNTRRPPSGNYNDRDFADRDYANSILNNTNNTNTYDANTSSNSTNSSANGGGGMSVEESIRRTQAMLNKRANGAGAAGSSTNNMTTTNTTNNTATNDTSKARTPTSGRSAHKLSESIQQASAMYPPSPTQRYRSTSDEDANEAQAFIDTPALRPISPPHHLSTASHTSSHTGANIGKDLEDEHSDDSDTEHTSSVAPYGNNPNIHYVSAGASSGAGGSGTGGSGGKKKKSAKKGTTSDGKYDGLQEALQLPKIASGGVKRK